MLCTESSICCISLRWFECVLGCRRRGQCQVSLCNGWYARWCFRALSAHGTKVDAHWTPQCTHPTLAKSHADILSTFAHCLFNTQNHTHSPYLFTTDNSQPWANGAAVASNGQWYSNEKSAWPSRRQWPCSQGVRACVLGRCDLDTQSWFDCYCIFASDAFLTLCFKKCFASNMRCRNWGITGRICARTCMYQSMYL